MAVAYGSVPFAQQIEFFLKKLLIPTDAWTDLWEAEHDAAFVVAGARNADLLSDLHSAVSKAINQGTTLEEFRKDFADIVQRRGWDHQGSPGWRARVIYDTNLRSSYQAGRYQQLQQLAVSRPYWMYIHSDAVETPRPEHEAWDGMVLPHDAPWWDAHYPPNGWGCQCTVEALNERDLARLGKSAPDQAPEVRMRTVTVGQDGPTPRTVTTPEGVDPGWAYTPGAARGEALDRLRERIQRIGHEPPTT